MDGLEFLDTLNPAQREAAETTEGYIRVIAGAGSGKTKTLTARYLYLVQALGVSTANILCVTFTNKAAAEMKKRIRRVLPDQDLALITTFHGFCVGLLKEDCHVLQYPSTFIVLDEEDKAAMLRGIFEELGITSRDMTVKDAIDYISWRKGGRGYVRTLIDMNPERLRELEASANTLKDKVMYRYFYEQRKCYGLDFDDIVYFALYCLRQDAQVRKKWQQRLEYAMVDEFQDIDKDQYELADILAGYHKNLFVVGDPDQTIYTWRGADVKFVLEFESRHENAKTISGHELPLHAGDLSCLERAHPKKSGAPGQAAPRRPARKPKAALFPCKDRSRRGGVDRAEDPLSRSAGDRAFPDRRAVSRTLCLTRR